jgi:hypothetical protein
MNYQNNIADQVYTLAVSQNAIAPMVKEAIQVIEAALDTHGWVVGCFIHQAIRDSMP